MKRRLRKLKKLKKQGERENDRKGITYCVEINATQPPYLNENQGQSKGESEMKNLSQIKKEREDILKYWNVGDITENWASERVACIAAFMEELDGEKDAIVRG